MNGYNFTERVRKVLAYSREEAFRLGQEFVGTEHMLLGLLREGEGVASVVLKNARIDESALRKTIVTTVATGGSQWTVRGDLPYTTRAKKTLELAMAESWDLQHSFVGTEHLLLGLLREEQGIAANVLREAGLTLEWARENVLQILGTDPRAVSDEKIISYPQTDSYEKIVRAYDLKPHREGGHYREIFRSSVRVKESDRDRSAITTIYYSLKNGEASRWHVVESDEVWHFYQGGSILLLDYDPRTRSLSRIVLGHTATSLVFTHAIPAGNWQAAVAAGGPCLAGCTVAPGFEFGDFRMVRDLEGHLEEFTDDMAGFRQLL